MKVYTEKQVIEMIEKSRKTGLTAEYLILTTHPIELPSDEEIEKFANEYVKNKWEYAQDENKESFSSGAKWMRDKIQGDNQ